VFDEGKTKGKKAPEMPDSYNLEDTRMNYSLSKVHCEQAPLSERI
jgi:hypothetical protein